MVKWYAGNPRNYSLAMTKWNLYKKALRELENMFILHFYHCFAWVSIHYTCSCAYLRTSGCESLEKFNLWYKKVPLTTIWLLPPSITSGGSLEAARCISLGVPQSSAHWTHCATLFLWCLKSDLTWWVHTGTVSRSSHTAAFHSSLKKTYITC